MCSKTKKIGIFDSGYGGLTILREIRKVLPGYDYLYLGDNARAPYGTHSFDVIYRYTLQAVRYLLEHECALVILACNTASAKALRTIQQRDLPLINARMTNDQMANDQKVNVLGVIRPTVEAVPALTQTGHVGILATPATVSSESYVLELQKVQSDNTQCAKELVVTQQSCPLWVPLIENGEHLNDGADYFVDKYLSALLSRDPQIDTLILGCTHYPLLMPKIEKWLESYSEQRERSYSNAVLQQRGLTAEGGHEISVISQGSLVARSLADYLRRHPEYESQLSQDGSCRYLTTENADRFSQSASLFLSSPVQAEHIDLE
jgi:glutamate racemase